MALLDGFRESHANSKAEKVAAREEENKIKFMNMAYKEAEKAYEEGDVPIGCVIVNEDGKVIGRQLPMQRFLPYNRLVRRWVTGDWKTVICM